MHIWKNTLNENLRSKFQKVITINLKKHLVKNNPYNSKLYPYYIAAININNILSIFCVKYAFVHQNSTIIILSLFFNNCNKNMTPPETYLFLNRYFNLFEPEISTFLPQARKSLYVQ